MNNSSGQSFTRRLRRYAVDPVAVDAYEFLAAAGDDVGPESIGSQVIHDFQHRHLILNGLPQSPAPLQQRVIRTRTRFPHLMRIRLITVRWS
jgi:hypothetical protein